MSVIHNERTKLTATYLNGVSIAIFAVGGLAPLFSNFYGNTARLFALHLFARRFLKRLNP